MENRFLKIFESFFKSPYPHNYKLYPGNMSKPYEVRVKLGFKTNTYKIHEYTFSGLYDFYNFLKQAPEANTKTFKALASLGGYSTFAGDTYEEGLEKIVKPSKSYSEFLQIEKSISKNYTAYDSFESTHSVIGGAIDVVRYVTGTPEIFITSKEKPIKQNVTINIQLAYNSDTTFEQLYNRAIIIVSLIKSLESQNYIVNVNTFMLGYDGDEIIKASFKIKRGGITVNSHDLFKSTCFPEFFRRLCFRLIEISDVNNSGWTRHYGATCDSELVRQILNLKQNDIYFDEPRKMGIEGKDIKLDFINCMAYLGLQDKMNVEKEANQLEASVKQYLKTENE